MSLSSILISAGGKKALDTELDALFNAKPIVVATPISIPGSSKDVAKKRKAAPESVVVEAPSKRSKSSPSKSSNKQRDQPHATPKSSKAQKPGNDLKVDKKPGGKGKAKEIELDSEDENADLENAYLDAHAPVGEQDESGANENEEEVADLPIMHESVKKNGKKTNRSGPKVKFVPADETPELRDQRTIFVGNLSVDVAQKRPLLKQLQRHILSQLPTAKIESTRFRSVPFQAPTSKLPDDDSSTPDGKPSPKAPTPSSKHPRAHDIDRISTWRSQRDDDDDTTATKTNEKKYLNPNQKKKIAFINHEFHATADTVNAYIVFAHPPPAGETRPANLPPPPAVLDPYEAARLAVRVCDGSLFMERVIRVDLVGRKHPALNKGKGKDGDGADAGGLDLELSLAGADPKSSVFVGNLDFASKEEDLRVFFEGVVSAERGPPPPPSVDEEEEVAGEGNVKKRRSWVTRVRIVRDKETQLGKGFAYVQFSHRECVDEVLALEPTKLKFAKRKLRVQRCRTLPGSSTSTRQATASNKDSSKNPTQAPVRIVVPKGDPALGEKLAHLPKEARKQYKSADADRVARRLAKKKARMAMGGAGGVKVLGKDRERVRKMAAPGAGSGGGKKVVSGSKKGRVRSEKSLAKRNGKKAGASSK